MAGFRSYFPDRIAQEGDTVTLSATESRHLAKALRAKPGDVVTLFNGRGHAWQARLLGVGRVAELTVEQELAFSPPPCRITLALALLKGKAMDAAVKFAVEIGASAVVPILSERTEVRLDANRAESKVDHLRAVAIEAAKQSGNLAAFKVSEPTPLVDWLGAKPEGLSLVASLQADAQPVAAALSSAPAVINCLIGPEGDFSPGEYEQIQAAGFFAVSLGDRVLRAETACAYFLSAADAVFRSRALNGSLSG